jgi:hypothetical protein
MTCQVIPEDIARFILDKIDTVAQLEGLLILRSTADGEWSAQSLAGRLYITEEETADLLRILCARELIITKAGKPPVFEYQPSSMELKEKVDRLARLYSKNLLAITSLIHSKPKTRVQQFADAFKLRKKE